MREFSIGEAWSNTVDFLRNHLQILLIVVGGGAVAGAVVQYLLLGGNQTAQLQAMMQAMASGNMQDMARINASNPAGAMAGLVGILAVLITTTTEFAGLRLILAPNEEEVGPALGYGLMATLLYLLAAFAVGLVAAIIIIVPIAAFGLGAGFASGNGGTGLAIFVLLLVMVLFPLILWLAARLSVFRAAMAQARSVNPLYGVAQSWQLTRGHALMILVYLFVVGVVMLVAMMIIGGIIAVIGSIGGGFFSMLLMSLLVAVPSAVFNTALAAGLYRTLAPDTHKADVFL